MRPQLARVGPDASDAAVRRVVLSVAQQQKLATCSALLREVAASYGFALHIAPDVGDEDLGAHATPTLFVKNDPKLFSYLAMREAACSKITTGSLHSQISCISGSAHHVFLQPKSKFSGNSHLIWPSRGS